VVGLECKRSLVAGKSVVVALKILKNGTAIKPSLDVVGLECKRSLVAGKSVVVALKII
jgi:hypothetical protein